MSDITGDLDQCKDCKHYNDCDQTFISADLRRCAQFHAKGAPMSMEDWLKFANAMMEEEHSGNT